MYSRPKNEEELKRREVNGIIRASRFVRQYARSDDLIDISIIRKIHKEIWKDAWPEIAGKNRNEDLKIADSKLLPPHFFGSSEANGRSR